MIYVRELIFLCRDVNNPSTIRLSSKEIIVLTASIVLVSFFVTKFDHPNLAFISCLFIFVFLDGWSLLFIAFVVQLLDLLDLRYTHN